MCAPGDPEETSRFHQTSSTSGRTHSRETLSPRGGPVNQVNTIFCQENTTFSGGGAQRRSFGPRLLLTDRYPSFPIITPFDSLLLIRAGDVEQNPGPLPPSSPQHSNAPSPLLRGECCKCSKTIRKGVNRLSCTVPLCPNLCHKGEKCSGIGRLSKMSWKCFQCEPQIAELQVSPKMNVKHFKP